MVKPKTRQKYSQTKKKQVILWRVQGKTYPEINVLAKERWGITIPKPTLSGWFTDTTEPGPNGRAPVVNEPSTELINRKIVDTIKTREEALGMLSRYLISLDNIEVAEVLKYKDLRAFIKSIVEVCDSIDRAKGSVPQITAQNVQINQINLSTMTGPEWDVFYKKFADEMCSACLIAKEYREGKYGK